MSTLPERQARRAIPIAALGAALALRGCVNAAFGAWLLMRHPSWTNVFQMGSVYAIADGALGLVAVGLTVALTPSGLLRILAAITCVDAIGRIAVGILVLVFPGLPHLPIAVVPFFAALGAGVAGLGGIGLAAWLVARARTRRGWSATDEAMFDPLVAAALVSFIVGFVLFANPPATLATLRVVAAAATGTLALVFLTASVGAIAHRRTAWDASSSVSSF